MTDADTPPDAGAPRAGRRTPPAPLRLAAVSAFALLVYGLVAPYLPATGGVYAGLAVALVVNLALFSGVVAGLSPLRTAGTRALVVAAAAAALSVPFGLLDWVPAANVAKVVAAAGLGYWLAGVISSLGVVLLVAVLSAVVDIVSVLTGPTKVLLERAPDAVGYLTVAFLWPGQDPLRFYTALGVADLIFFALYVGAAQKFALRSTATVVGVAAGIGAAVVVGLWTGPMPALPWLAAGFLVSNADLLLGRGRSLSSDGS